jgi:SAM-dependent methyltransferase
MTSTEQDQARPAHDMWAAIDYTAIGTRETLVSELLARAVDVRPGDRVLDIATGTGNTALAAARRAAVVTGCDLSPANLTRAARRAEVDTLSVEWQVADAQALPFQDGQFDVVLSTFGVMYAADHEKAAAELLRVCRPGGRIGLVSWSAGLFSELGVSFAANAPAGARPAPSGPPPVCWGDERYVRDLFGDRVRELVATRRAHEFRHVSARAQAELFREHLPPFHALYRALNPELQWRILDATADVFERFNRATDGTLVAPASYLEVVAVRE